MREIKKKVSKYYKEVMLYCVRADQGIHSQIAITQALIDRVWKEMKKEGILPKGAFAVRFDHEKGELVYKLV